HAIDCVAWPDVAVIMPLQPVELKQAAGRGDPYQVIMIDKDTIHTIHTRRGSEVRQGYAIIAMQIVIPVRQVHDALAVTIDRKNNCKWIDARHPMYFVVLDIPESTIA